MCVVDAMIQYIDQIVLSKFVSPPLGVTRVVPFPTCALYRGDFKVFDHQHVSHGWVLSR